MIKTAILEVSSLPPSLKHPTIFEHFDALLPGEGFVIDNDHDPKPLYYQLIAQRGAVFTWSYLEEGPQRWKVQIRKNEATDSPTVGEIAAKDVRKAELLKKRGIDFCCGGKRTLKEACEVAGLSLTEVEAELRLAEQSKQPGGHHFDSWSLDFLADYIYNNHHQYVRESAAIIEEMAIKVANRHGASYPELFSLAQNVKEFLADMLQHLQKEEAIVFPYIRQLLQKKSAPEQSIQFVVSSIQSPIRMMEEEHQESGEDLEYFRKATHNYQLPEGACNSHTFLYQKMQEFENDLLQHIHLENNILFPKALKLEQELLQTLN
jgi:regulator of cell morphogenesis and NO signaling